MSHWWSWFLTVYGLFGFYVTSTGRKWGWLVNISAQVPWIIYSIVTEQYGFIIASLCYAYVFTRNYLKAK